MRKSNIVNIAVFMIFLIVTLPIYSASAMAATITDVQAYGKDSIPGFRAQTDMTAIKVKASIPEDPEIGTGQVKMLEDPTLPFECTLVDEATKSYECLHEYPEMTLSAATGVLPFTIQIMSDAGAPLSAARSGSLVVDSKPPKIISVKYSPKPGGLVEAEFQVKDEACNKPQCANKCSGVGAIHFTVAGLPIGQAQVSGTGCDQIGTVNLTGLTIGGEVVTKHICVEAFDKLGQSGSKCEDVVIDVRPPVITGVGLFDINNKPVKYTNGQPIGNVKIVINITEDSKLVNPRSPTTVQNILYVNASSLSERPEQQAAYGNLQLLCRSLGGNAYTCDFGGLFFIASAQRDISVRVEGRDEFDNILNETKAFSVLFDNTPPVATKIYSSFPDDKGGYWIREDKNIITMDITETGSGMSNRYAFLDFSGFGPQELAREGTAITLLAPNDCADGWTCNWRSIKTNKEDKATLYLSPQAGSRDDANNVMQSATGTLQVDKSAPEVLRDFSNMTGTGEGHPAMTNLSSGDTLEIHLFVKDYSGVKSAKANFSDIIQDGPVDVEGECAENQVIASDPQRIFDCVWTTEAIKDGYKKNLEIQFSIDDYTNHTLNYTWDGIEILARENETETRWTVTVPDGGISPSLGIDRLSWGLASQRIYYKIEMEQTGVVTDIVSINFDPQTCYGIEWVNQDSVSSKYLVSRMGFADFTANPARDIVVIELNPGNVPEYYMTDADGDNVSVDSVFVNCTFTFTSIVNIGGDQRALSMPEDVNVSFEIPVYNNPLGQNIGNLLDKIKDEEDYVSGGGWKFVYYANMILQYAKEICRFIETYIQLMQMWAGFKDMFTEVCNAGTPTTDTACGASSVAGQTTNSFSDATDGFMGELYYFCGLFISCRLSEKAKEAMNKQCTGEDSNWCKLKKWWGKYNSMWAEYAGLNFLGSKYKVFGERTVGQVQVGGETRNVTKGLQLFSVDDFDPTRSMFSSALSLCLPGVLLNIEKFRQIKCKRLLCWKIEVPNGRPLWQCEKQYDYDMCTYWTGQAFAAIPIFQYVEQIGNIITRIIKQPLSFILGWVLDKACQVFLCGNERAAGCKACKVLQYASSLAAIVTDLVTNTGARFAAISSDLCEEAVKEEPSYDNIAGYAKPPEETPGEGGGDTGGE